MVVLEPFLTTKRIRIYNSRLLDNVYPDFLMGEFVRPVLATTAFRLGKAMSGGPIFDSNE